MTDLKTCLGNETSLFSTMFMFYPFLITIKFSISVRVCFMAVQDLSYMEERWTTKTGKLLVSLLHPISFWKYF